jgi:Histidine kinase-, DNA gyrase B-, and HSP90-like ATPase
MKGRRLKLKTRSDFVQRLTQAPMMGALEELIWNCFDERSHTVQVSLKVNELGGVDEIEIADDGQSLPYERAAEAFENLGCSNKVTRTLESGERLHGRKGEGRHKALSLGNCVTWHFTYNKTGQHFSYEIIGSAGREDPFFLTTEERVEKNNSVGCRVTITDIAKSLHALTQADARRHIASQFAPFLLRHPDRSLIFHGKQIRPQAVIAERRRLHPFNVMHEHQAFKMTVEVIHWKDGNRREFFLCTEDGIPLHEVNHRSLTASANFSVFASSDLFDQLHDQNLLTTVEITADSGRKEIINLVRKKVRRYFRRRLQSESDEALQRLREEGSYPYASDPRSDLDRVERRVFDLCAVNISRHLPSFSEKMDVDGRKLLLRVIREALSQNPTSVGKIIREVCRLPERDAKSLARLLDDVPLRHVVQLGTMVSERLQFLKFFEAIVHLDPFDRVVKERTQLHRILASNTWLFGEEYALGTDDENLASILAKHVGLLGRDHLQPELRDQDIQKLLSAFNRDRRKTPESLARIPDLMLWRRFVERRPDEYEFLVVELKRPGVPIGRKEIAQIEDYAKAVVTTPFADSERTQWVFVVVSDALDEHAMGRAHQQGMPAYTIQKPLDFRYEIRALPWSQLVRAAMARHNHLEKWLNYSVTRERVFELAEETYAEFLPPPKKVRRAVLKSGET